MSTTLRTTVRLAGWVSCIVLLAGLCLVPMAGATFAEQGREQAGEQAKDRYEHSRVLVEAFVAEVKLESLYKLEASPIGQKPDSVSIENILQCLKDPDSGKVTAGTKVAVGQNGNGVMSVTERKNIKRPVPASESVRPGRRLRGPYDTYEVSKQFAATASVREDGKIRVSFEFSQNTLAQCVSDSNAPPNTISRRWENWVWLEAGKPSIVGATQNEDRAAFLILTADIDSE